MNRDHYSIITLVLLLFTISCNNAGDNNISTATFEEEYFIQGEKMNVGEYYDFNMVVIIDTFLLISTERADKHLLHAFNTRNGTRLGEIISRGRGPCEVVRADIIPQTDEIETGLMHIYDISQLNVTEINLSQLFLNPNYRCRRVLIEIPNSEGPFLSIKYRGEDIIIYENGRTRFSIYNHSMKSTISVPYQSESFSYKLKNERESRLFYSGGLRVNSRLGRIASTPYSVGQIDFYEITGEHRSTIIYCDYDELKKSIEQFNNEESPSLNSLNLYSFNLFSDNDFIYVSSTTPVLKREEVLNPQTDLSKYKSELLIFDWEGVPVRKVVLDRFLIQIGMDLKEKVVYGLSPSLGEGLEMYKYPFANIKGN